MSMPRAATSVQMRNLTSPFYKGKSKMWYHHARPHNLERAGVYLALNFCKFDFLSAGFRSLWRHTQLNLPWAVEGPVKHKSYVFLSVSTIRLMRKYSLPPPRVMKYCSRLSQSSLVRQKMIARSICCCSMARTIYAPFSSFTASDSNS